MFSSVFSEKKLVKQLRLVERNMMLKRKLQHETAQLFASTSCVQLLKPVIPGAIQLASTPSGEFSRHADKVFPDRPITPSLQNNEVLRLASERRHRLETACVVAELTKTKLKEEISKALAKRQSKASTTIASQPTSEGYTIPKRKPIPRRSSTVAKRPPSSGEDSDTGSQASLTSMFRHSLPTTVSQPKRRKYDKFSPEKDISDGNNNSISEEDNMCEDTENVGVNIGENVGDNVNDSVVIDPDMPTLHRFDSLDTDDQDEDVVMFQTPIASSTKQTMDFDRSTNFDNMLYNLSTYSSLEEVVDKDYLQRDRLPVSDEVLSTVTSLNTQFSHDVRDTHKRTRSQPKQP